MTVWWKGRRGSEQWLRRDMVTGGKRSWRALPTSHILSYHLEGRKAEGGRRREGGGVWWRSSAMFSQLVACYSNDGGGCASKGCL